jgi:hypothetical protein
MQKNETIIKQEKVQVKTEVITIDEDDIQVDNCKEKSKNCCNSGNDSELIYYFEPQKISKLINGNEKKSKFNNHYNLP